MGIRDKYQMVSEDDPQWTRFWESFPKRESKKEARRVWAKLNPTPELVDRIVGALAWQVPLHRWNGEKRQFAPLPATYLNNERWTDEPPINGNGHKAVEPWICPHLEPCAHRAMCDAATILGRPRK